MRFTIRDLLWLTIVAACLLGWWLEHAKLADVRLHAWVLRDTMRHARYRFEPLTSNSEWGIDWTIADDPIP